jgi:hypothetical protein
MSNMLWILIGFVFGGALGLWIGCRYGCGWINAFILECKEFLSGIGWALIYVLLVLLILLAWPVALIILGIYKALDWILKLPWKRWWRSLRWLWWLIAVLLLILAAFLAFLGFLPAALGLALLAGFLLFALLGLLGSIIAMIAGFAALLLGSLQGIGKWLTALFASVSLTLPSCDKSPIPPSPAPLVAAPAQAPILPQRAQEEACTFASIENGDGTIRATARGGHPLGLVESIEWSRKQGEPVRQIGKYIHAPTLHPSYQLKWCDDTGWILIRPTKPWLFRTSLVRLSSSWSFLTRNTSPKNPTSPYRASGIFTF